MLTWVEFSNWSHVKPFKKINSNNSKFLKRNNNYKKQGKNICLDIAT